MRNVTDGEISLPGGRYRDAFAVREFTPLFTAYVLSLVGDVIAAVALTVLVFQRTGSPLRASRARSRSCPRCSAARS